ncbi:hypothetical protein GCM10010409_09400 [Mycolicibacterium diernhoferi]|uniref:AAA family ATPase n=2 Tax=Mycolicibacterium diernhoferi TaxID=1801 RepID=A0A1Q4H703_9MYCO|nr:hypothetical protein BRW64_23365 [Mycolicibacterium diernhoferi]PEG55363.1 hypothetical protein CRI78_07285 [Mycolicibacterium diernhoferi]
MPPSPAGAAADALGRGDLAAAEDLARAALRAGESLPARLTLAQALAWQGRGRDADAVLAEVDPGTLAEADLVAWALPRAANQFWMLDEPERATAFLRATRARLQSATTVDALLSTFAMNAGSPQRALDLAEAVLRTPDAEDRAIGWAASTAALSAARMGRFAPVDSLAMRASAAGHPGLLRFTSAFGQTTALTMAGELDRAESLARQLAAPAQPSSAIAQVLLGEVLLTRGELDEAVSLLWEAATALSVTGYSWGPLAWMLSAQALGRQGRAVDAAKALARAESRHGLKSMLFAPELALARAWTCSARRDPVGAVAAARDAARAAARGGQSAVAVRALHDAACLGDNRAGESIAALEMDCTFAGLALEHARALAGRDDTRLESVAKRLAAFGISRTSPGGPRPTR